MPASNRYTPHYDLKSGVASLKINDTQSNDSGFYEVVAENVAGADKTSASLIVDNSPSIDKTPIIDPSAFRYLNPVEHAAPVQSPKDQLKASPPRVIVPLNDINAAEGQQVALLCKIVGTPKPRVIWLHNNKPILDSIRYTYALLVSKSNVLNFYSSIFFLF